jgi:hypothetical protein
VGVKAKFSGSGAELIGKRRLEGLRSNLVSYGDTRFTGALRGLICHLQQVFMVGRLL